MSPENQSRVYLTNRSAAETDDKCGMAFWWSQHEAGTGIVPVDEAEELTIGRDIHEDMQAIATAEDISAHALEEICEMMVSTAPARDKETLKKMDILYRRMGWLAAYALFIEPTLREKWENVTVEDELILDRTPLWVAVTPDRVVRHKTGGYLVYREYKSTISASQKWLESWQYAIQLHIGIKAIEEEFVTSGQQSKIAYAQIMGLMKGDNYKDHLVHPYVWAYRHSHTGEWTHEYNKARSAGWEPRPVWEYPDGIVKWVQRLGYEVAVQQFPHTRPVTLNQRMLDAWVTRRLAREVEVAEVKDTCGQDWDSRVVHFEPRTRNCRPPFGFQCPYLGPCWNASIQKDPLAHPMFIRRTPHHEVELTFQGE